jgi:hypothetical protein
MSRRKPLAAAAAVMAALALTAPVASASTAKSTPKRTPKRTKSATATRPFPPGPNLILCGLLAQQYEFAVAIGNPILANLIVRTSNLQGCSGGGP